MNTLKQNNNKPEIYSTSGFRDTLASPVFYPVIVVALVLGVTSIFGFVQNPLKLKAVVNVIHQKVAVTKVVNESFREGFYSVSKSEPTLTSETSFKPSVKAFDLFSNINETTPEKMAVEGNFERIAFNYDVTSESFWSDLDSSSLETATEEMERKEKESTTFGSPLEIDHQQRFPAEYDLQDKSIYALNILK